jgi:hypothetical protein
MLGKHHVSYLANFTNRQHLRAPTEFLARAGRARPRTSCQPHSSTEPRLPLHDGRATSPESPRVSFCTTGGRPTRVTGDTSAFLLHEGRATYPSHPCHTERRAPSLPATSPDNRNLCVSCVLAQERAHVRPRLFCDLLHYFALFS